MNLKSFEFVIGDEITDLVDVFDLIDRLRDDGSWIFETCYNPLEILIEWYDASVLLGRCS